MRTFLCRQNNHWLVHEEKKNLKWKGEAFQMQLVVKRTQIYIKCITTCVALLDCVSCPSHGLYIPCSCGQPQFYWGGSRRAWHGFGMAWGNQKTLALYTPLPPPPPLQYQTDHSNSAIILVIDIIKSRVHTVEGSTPPPLYLPCWFFNPLTTVVRWLLS